mmetsp:Transcript_5822/g.8665  ORF Transcript_5822/g.8665 Transcript_5822/m.8665 type:complete len:121 (-) Transcript_5822:36-398(-)
MNFARVVLGFEDRVVSGLLREHCLSVVQRGGNRKSRKVSSSSLASSGPIAFHASKGTKENDGSMHDDTNDEGAGDESAVIGDSLMMEKQGQFSKRNHAFDTKDKAIDGTFSDDDDGFVRL